MRNTKGLRLASIKDTIRTKMRRNTSTLLIIRDVVMKQKKNVMNICTGQRKF